MSAYPRNVTALCIAVGLADLGALVALAFLTPAPAVVPLVVFAALALYAGNRAVDFADGTDFSAGFMLEVGAVVVFRPHGSLLGPLVVGMCCGLSFAHVRAGDWRKIAFNVGNFGLATLAAALVLRALPPSWLAHPPLLLLAAVPIALAFFVVNEGLVALVVSMESRRPLWPTVHDIAMSSIESLPFALFGAFMGRLYLDFGAAIVPLFIVPVLVARETFASYLALKKSYDDTIRILIGALESKDPYTAGHAGRVATFAQYIGIELGLPPKRLERLRLAALMHDVGKLVVPNHLLNKPGKLTAAEFARVRQHETVSVEILTRIEFLAPVAPSALSEFTKFRPVADRTGQPIEPHVVAVADAFDAMTSTRPYRRALSQTTAFMELRQYAGDQFHPRVVDALIIAIERRGERYGAGYEAEAVEFAVEPPRAGPGSAGLGDIVPEPGHSRAER